MTIIFDLIVLHVTLLLDKNTTLYNLTMPYYGLFSRDLHILDLWQRSRCTHYFLWILPMCALFLCSMTHYDITIGHDVAKDAPLWHHSR